MFCRLSIVVPTLNEAAGLREILQLLQPLRSEGDEVIAVDGGSQDDTVPIALPLVDRVIRAPRGRAVQMNAGAQVARGDVLLFLHADTRLPSDAHQTVCTAMAQPEHRWGRFDVRLSSRRTLLRLVEYFMNLRSRMSGIATGDQALFVKRSVFEAVGGFPSIPLMEDIALSRKLKAVARPVCLRQRVTTSSRRWEQKGIFRTVLLMWGLRFAYALGADPVKLAHRYYRD